MVKRRMARSGSGPPLLAHHSGRHLRPWRRRGRGRRLRRGTLRGASSTGATPVKLQHVLSFLRFGGRGVGALLGRKVPAPWVGPERAQPVLDRVDESSLG